MPPGGVRQLFVRCNSYACTSYDGLVDLGVTGHVREAIFVYPNFSPVRGYSYSVRSAIC